MHIPQFTPRYIESDAKLYGSIYERSDGRTISWKKFTSVNENTVCGEFILGVIILPNYSTGGVVRFVIIKMIISVYDYANFIIVIIILRHILCLTSDSYYSPLNAH